MISEHPTESPAYDIVPPRAEVVTEALRAVGYDFATAIADIVDNSISANATQVSVEMTWNGNGSWVRVEDNGHGMSELELVEAMRLGSRSPLLSRPPHDLGRFGLGLKTASFSQARRLVVQSKSAGLLPATRCWDLDVVKQRGEWILLKAAPNDTGSSLVSDLTTTYCGTVVLWQKLDRVVPDATHPRAHDRFLALISRVAEHLGMTFHRFLVGPKRLSLTLNGQPVPPWDPFLARHPATQVLPDEQFDINGSTITLQPYVLPHESKLLPDEHIRAAGPAGWNAQQGFYVYRSKRLLVAGSWLGLPFQQEEHYKLARIQLDIPNSLDEDWQIDIRKATARPPSRARDPLLRVAKATRKQAKLVYGYRGAQLARRLAGDLIPVWKHFNLRGGPAFRLNREHPLLKRLLNGNPPNPGQVNEALSVIEETIPVNLILTQFAENRSSQSAPFQGKESQLRPLLDGVIENLSLQGLDPNAIRDRLLRMEPFNHYPEMVAVAFAEMGVDDGREV
jgi:hypothetical protein